MKRGPANLAEQVVELLEEQYSEKLARLEAYEEYHENDATICVHCSFPVARLYHGTKCSFCHQMVYCGKSWCNPEDRTCFSCNRTIQACNSCLSKHSCADCNQISCCGLMTRCVGCRKYYCSSKVSAFNINVRDDLVAFSSVERCRNCVSVLKSTDITAIENCVTCLQMWMDRGVLPPECPHASKILKK